MNRIDGLIWIDRNKPHRLKYHIDGVDYVVEVAADYNYVVGEEGLYAGTVVKLVGEKEVAPAEFPDDIDNILGVNQVTIPPGSTDTTASISRSGYIILSQEDINNVFFDPNNDLNLEINGWGIPTSANDMQGIGAPVYWFIGKSYKDGEEFKYNDPSEGLGKLTFSTPSGYRWNITEFTDDQSLNIKYENLPQIGNVARYSYEGNKITSLAIHLNFSSFDTSMEWNYPCYTPTEGTETVSGLKVEDSWNTFRHGLFPNKGTKMIHHVNVLCTDVSNTYYNDIDIKAPIRDDFTNKTSEVYFNIPYDDIKEDDIRIMGEIRYNLEEN